MLAIIYDKQGKVSIIELTTMPGFELSQLHLFTSQHSNLKLILQSRTPGGQAHDLMYCLKVHETGRTH